MDHGESITLTIRSRDYRNDFLVTAAIAVLLLIASGILLSLSGLDLETIRHNASDEQLKHDRHILMGFIGMFAGMFGIAFVLFTFMYLFIPQRTWRIDATTVRMESRKRLIKRIPWDDVDSVSWRRREVKLKTRDGKIRIPDLSGMSSWSHADWNRFQRFASDRLKPRFQLEIPATHYAPRFHTNAWLDRLALLLFMLSIIVFPFITMVLHAEGYSLIGLILFTPHVLWVWMNRRKESAHNWRRPVSSSQSDAKTSGER